MILILRIGLNIIVLCCEAVESGIGNGKIGYGMNLDDEFKNMPSKHAEIDALNKIKNKKNIPKNIDLLVIKLTKSGKLSSSRPCIHCLNSLEKSNLKFKNIYYSDSNGNILKEKFSNMKNNPTTYISSGKRP